MVPRRPAQGGSGSSENRWQGLYAPIPHKSSRPRARTESSKKSPGIRIRSKPRSENSEATERDLAHGCERTGSQAESSPIKPSESYSTSSPADLNASRYPSRKEPHFQPFHKMFDPIGCGH